MNEQLVQFDIPGTILPGHSFYSKKLSLPTGKRLLIDYVSAKLELPKGQRGYIRLRTRPVSFSPHTPFATFRFFLHPATASLRSGWMVYILGQETRLFTEKTLYADLVRDSGPVPLKYHIKGTIDISGRLVDIP